MGDVSGSQRSAADPEMIRALLTLTARDQAEIDPHLPFHISGGFRHFRITRSLLRNVIALRIHTSDHLSRTLHISYRPTKPVRHETVLKEDAQEDGQTLNFGQFMITSLPEALS